jgi:hypothetical protein
MSKISTDTFDGAALWLTLPSDLQARLGSLFLELAAAETVQTDDCEIAARAAAEAERIIRSQLSDALPYAFDDERMDHEVRHKISSALGAVCTRCGCSQNDPCDDGCGWHDEITCTACA